MNKRKHCDEEETPENSLLEECSKKIKEPELEFNPNKNKIKTNFQHENQIDKFEKEWFFASDKTIGIVTTSDFERIMDSFKQIIEKKGSIGIWHSKIPIALFLKISDDGVLQSCRTIGTKTQNKTELEGCLTNFENLKLFRDKTSAQKWDSEWKEQQRSWFLDMFPISKTGICEKFISFDTFENSILSIEKEVLRLLDLGYQYVIKDYEYSPQLLKFIKHNEEWKQEKLKMIQETKVSQFSDRRIISGTLFQKKVKYGEDVFIEE
jgi:hypothetical protein